MLLRVASFGHFKRIWKPLLAVCAAALLGLVGLVMGIEMLYHLTLESANGSVMVRFGKEIDTKALGPWLVTGGLLLAGILAYRKTQPAYYAVWSDVNAEIVAKQRGSMA